MQWRLWLLGVALALPQARAVDNWDVEGEHGVLNVYGALTESPCSLDMESRRQAIRMGETGTAQLQRVGDRGTPVTFTLRLNGCLHTSTRLRDTLTDSRMWSLEQPALAITFTSEADSYNSQLIKAHGVSGMGLRLMQTDGRSVPLGTRAKAQWLTPGSNVLTWQVVPERTALPLVVGAYRAVVDFRLSYD